jgi:UMP-CMP kinase
LVKHLYFPIKAMKKSGQNKFLIDGFPRNKDNLDGWQREMGDKTHVKFVLFFDCSQEVSFNCFYF